MGAGQHGAARLRLGIERAQRRLLAWLHRELDHGRHRRQRIGRRADGAFADHVGADPAGDLFGEEPSEAGPADPPHHFTDEPAERHAVVAVPGPGLPGRHAGGHALGEGDRVGPAGAVPRQEVVGSGQTDGTGLVAEQLAHRRALFAGTAELGPVPGHPRVQVEVAPVLEDMRAHRRQAFGRGHDDGPRLGLPGPSVRSGGPAPDVDDAFAVDERGEGAASLTEICPSRAVADDDRRTLTQRLGHPLEPRCREAADRAAHSARNSRSTSGHQSLRHHDTLMRSTRPP